MVNDCSDNLDAMAVASLRGKLQQAAKVLRLNRERFVGSGFFDGQIFRSGDHQPDSKQLTLAVKNGRADAADLYRAIDQFLCFLHWQVTDIYGQPATTGR